jgi:hypothetical protein
MLPLGEAVKVSLLGHTGDSDHLDCTSMGLDLSERQALNGQNVQLAG